MASDEEYLDNLLKTMLEDSVSQEDKNIMEEPEINIEGPQINMEEPEINMEEPENNIEEPQMNIEESEIKEEAVSEPASALDFPNMEETKAELVEELETASEPMLEFPNLEELELEPKLDTVESTFDFFGMEEAGQESVAEESVEPTFDFPSMEETVAEPELKAESELEEEPEISFDFPNMDALETASVAEETPEPAFDFPNIEGTEEASVTDLLDAFGEDEDLAEINELLKKNDDNILVEDDMMDLLNGFEEEPSEEQEESASEQEENNDFDIFADTEGIEEPMEISLDELDALDLIQTKGKGEESDSLEDIDSLLRDKSEQPETAVKGKKEKRVKREKKVPKEKVVKEGEEASGEAKGFLGKLFATLFEADEELETFDSTTEGTMPSDENIEILKELDKEKGKKKKGKKGKKGKEDSKESAKDGESDGDEEALDEKSKKKVKEKKPKKEKKKVENLPPEKEKKISKKKIIQIFVLCFSFMAVILVLVNFIPSILENASAKASFYKGDYIEAYQMLYGKKLTKSDELIFHKTETILKLDRKYQSFLGYQAMEKPLEAIDALMQGVQLYPSLLVKAEEYDAVEALNAVYTTILEALQSNYGLAEAQAKEIVAYEDDYDYTKRLQSIVFGTEFIDPNMPEPESEVILEDMLPGEEGLTPDAPLADPLPGEELMTMEPTTEETGTTAPAETEVGNKEIPIISADVERTE